MHTLQVSIGQILIWIQNRIQQTNSKQKTRTRVFGMQTWTDRDLQSSCRDTCTWTPRYFRRYTSHRSDTVWRRICYSGTLEYKKCFFVNFRRTSVRFVGPLIPLFWTSGNVCPGLQSQAESLASQIKWIEIYLKSAQKDLLFLISNNVPFLRWIQGRVPGTRILFHRPNSLTYMQFLTS